MARQYSPKSLLRQALNHLLQRYLMGLGIGKEIPWQHLGDKDTDLIHRVIERAGETVRQQIDLDFREIYNMADEGGIRTLIKEGRDSHHGVELTQRHKAFHRVFGLRVKCLRVEELVESGGAI